MPENKCTFWSVLVWALKHDLKPKHIGQRICRDAVRNGTGVAVGSVVLARGCLILAVSIINLICLPFDPVIVFFKDIHRCFVDPDKICEFRDVVESRKNSQSR